MLLLLRLRHCYVYIYLLIISAFFLYRISRNLSLAISPRFGCYLVADFHTSICLSCLLGFGFVVSSLFHTTSPALINGWKELYFSAFPFHFVVVIDQRTSVHRLGPIYVIALRTVSLLMQLIHSAAESVPNRCSSFKMRCCDCGT